MSVLIKGMKKPKDCYQCRLHYGNGECGVSVDGNCPIIEIPDHGDLIDRDVLMTRLGMAMDCEGCPNRTAVYFCGLPREVMEVCDELEKAPAVIPAERSEDGEN